MPVYSLTKKITLEREDYFLLPGYTMSDLGFIQQVLDNIVQIRNNKVLFTTRYLVFNL